MANDGVTVTPGRGRRPAGSDVVISRVSRLRPSMNGRSAATKSAGLINRMDHTRKTQFDHSGETSFSLATTFSTTFRDKIVTFFFPSSSCYLADREAANALGQHDPRSTTSIRRTAQ